MASDTGPAAVRIGTEFVGIGATVKWVATPVLNVDGDLLITTGKRFRVAIIRGQQDLEKEIDDPQRFLNAL